MSQEIPVIRPATPDDEARILQLICTDPGEESIILMDGSLTRAKIYRRKLIQSETRYNPNRKSFVIECTEFEGCHDAIAVIQLTTDRDDHHNRRAHLKILLSLLGVVDFCCILPKLAARRKVDVPRPENTVHILNINVDPEYQKQGLGAALLDYAQWYAQSAGCERVSLDKLTSEEELTAWYEKHGFKITHKVMDPSYEKHFGIKGRLLMEKVV